MMKTNKRKSYRIEERTGDAERVQLVRNTYKLNSDAAVFRQSLMDEVVLLTAATHPKSMTAFAAISRAKSGQPSALDRVLLRNADDAEKSLQTVTAQMADCEDLLQALLSDLHGMATNLNQITHKINWLKDDLDEDEFVAALALIEGLRKDFVAPIRRQLKHIEGVMERGDITI